MKPHDVMAEVTKLALERGWAEGSPQEVYLWTLFSAREDARRRLLTGVASLRRTLDDLEHMLKRPSPALNTLGELQRQPAAVEAAVGVFAAADKALGEYLKAFPVAAEEPSPSATISEKKGKR